MKYRFEILIPAPVDSDLMCIPVGYDGSDKDHEAWAFVRYPDEALKKPNTILVVRDGVTDDPISFAYIEKKKGKRLRVITVTEYDPSSKSMLFGQTPTSWKSNEHPEWKMDWAARWNVPEYKLQAAAKEWIETAIQELKIDPSVFVGDRESARIQNETAGNVISGHGRTAIHEIASLVYEYYTHRYKYMFHSIRGAYNFAGVPLSKKKYCDIVRKHISLIDLLLARTISEKLAGYSD